MTGKSRKKIRKKLREQGIVGKNAENYKIKKKVKTGALREKKNELHVTGNFELDVRAIGHMRLATILRILSSF